MQLLKIAATILLLALTAPSLANDVDDYQNSWVHQALSLQRQLDAQAPLAQATFIATHNSYNSSVWTTPVRYIDPNQWRSVRDQLRMDVRALEFDVHTYFSMQGWPWEWHNELLLCHGQDNDLGCSSYDRKFRDGLEDIRHWLEQSGNQHEVVILYIEDHMDGGWYDDAIDDITDTIGSWVYRPASGSCEGIPMSLSKADILSSGKQVLLMTDGCNNGFNAWVYGGIGDSLNGFPTGDVENLSYPDCQSSRFSRGFYDTHIVRYYEDRTNLSAVFGDPGDPITAQKLPELLACGVNLIGLDKLTPNDGRLQAAVWSWNQGEPNDWNGNEDCAMQYANGRFNDLNCSASKRFACHKPGTHEWYVTHRSGSWSEGDDACRDETNGDFRFSVPTNAHDNRKLVETKQYAGVTEVWLNYSDRQQEGKWQATDANSHWHNWQAGEPNNWANSEDCAMQYANGHYNDLACGVNLAFACQNPSTNEWYVTQGRAPWSQGDAICHAETNGLFRFALPTSSADNQKLMAAKQHLGINSVWLNYSDHQQEGRWQVGN